MRSAIFYHHVAQMKTDSYPNPLLRSRCGIAGGKRLLDFDSTSRGIDGARELHQKAIPDCVQFAARMLQEDCSQNFTMYAQQLNCKGVVLLGKRAVAHHVGEHEGGKLALFGPPGFGRAECREGE